MKNAVDEEITIPQSEENTKVPSYFNANYIKRTSLREKIKDAISTIQSVLTILAIMTAVYLYFEQRESLPKIQISHEITHRQITNSWVWVRTAVTVSNIGKRVFYLKNGIIRIQKILPLDQEIKDLIEANKHPIPDDDGDINRVVRWPELDRSYTPMLTVMIEPGEVAKLSYEFIIPSYIETVKIYSWFNNPDSPTNGWSEVTIYDLKKGKGAGRD